MFRRLPFTPCLIATHSVSRFRERLAVRSTSFHSPLHDRITRIAYTEAVKGMHVSCSVFFRRVAAASAAAVPPNYSNTPYNRAPARHGDDDDDDDFSPNDTQPHRTGFTRATTDSTRLAHRGTHARNVARYLAAHRAATLALTTATPSPLRPTCIDPSRAVTSFNANHRIHSFRRAVCASADLAMRPMMFMPLMATPTIDGPPSPAASMHPTRLPGRKGANTFGERLRDRLSCRWAAKFYGKVTFGPRNYPYPSSRWLARRFQMKKHRIVKRFRFRRYKLAAVANLPFAKMIRVGMLPELKSSKTKKADAVDAGLSAQLVSAAKSSTGGKTKGKRSRPKSKYQV